jgi:hypothetical protein
MIFCRNCKTTMLASLWQQTPRVYIFPEVDIIRPVHAPFHLHIRPLHTKRDLYPTSFDVGDQTDAVPQPPASSAPNQTTELDEGMRLKAMQPYNVHKTLDHRSGINRGHIHPPRASCHEQFCSKSPSYSVSRTAFTLSETSDTCSERE